MIWIWDNLEKILSWLFFIVFILSTGIFLCGLTIAPNIFIELDIHPYLVFSIAGASYCLAFVFAVAGRE
jgi:hypothetical protein